MFLRVRKHVDGWTGEPTPVNSAQSKEVAFSGCPHLLYASLDAGQNWWHILVHSPGLSTGATNPGFGSTMDLGKLACHHKNDPLGNVCCPVANTLQVMTGPQQIGGPAHVFVVPHLFNR